MPGQGLDVLRFQGFGVHLGIAQAMELVGDQGQHALALDLGAIAPVPVVLAELLQLVVQASHWCIEPSIQFFSNLVSVSDHLPTVIRQGPPQ